MPAKLSSKEKKVLDLMEKRGGEFIRALSKAYRVGTKTDRQRIKACWLEYWWAYEEMLQ